MEVWDGMIDIAVRAAVSEERMCSNFRITVLNTFVGIITIYFNFLPTGPVVRF